MQVYYYFFDQQKWFIINVLIKVQAILLENCKYCSNNLVHI